MRHEFPESIYSAFDESADRASHAVGQSYQIEVLSMRFAVLIHNTVAVDRPGRQGRIKNELQTRMYIEIQGQKGKTGPTEAEPWIINSKQNLSFLKPFQILNAALRDTIRWRSPVGWSARTWLLRACSTCHSIMRLFRSAHRSFWQSVGTA